MAVAESTEQIVALTPAAVKQVRYLIQKKGDPNLGLRIAVRGGGCSGLSYVMDLQPEPKPEDHVLEIDGLRVFIDPKSVRFLSGVTVDYSLKNLLGGGFTFVNPNAARSCGCGTSFTPKG